MHRVYEIVERRIANDILSCEKNSLGHQFLGEYTGCKRLPNSDVELKRQMEEAADVLGANVVASVFHKFNPHGISGVIVIAESHFAIHTWPEYNCAAVDLFTCGKLKVKEGLNFLAQIFEAESFELLSVPRGGGIRHY